MASEAGQLQLNAFEPIMSRSLNMSIAYLKRGCRVFADLCVDGITANVEYLRQTVENSIGLVTALGPTIGYEKATAIAKKASEGNLTVRQAAMDLGYLTAAEFDDILGNIAELTGD
jgi:aspartate ammonia-lyase